MDVQHFVHSDEKMCFFPTIVIGVARVSY